MPGKYSIDGNQAVASPTDSVLGLTSAATVKPRIYDTIIGSLATPADNAVQFLYQRYTASGTGTAVTPRALDPDDPAALAASEENHTVEPTYTSDEILLNIPLNQRATYRIPLVEKGELVCPKTADNGIGVQPVHSSFTGDVTCTIHFQE